MMRRLASLATLAAFGSGVTAALWFLWNHDIHVHVSRPIPQDESGILFDSDELLTDLGENR